MAQVGNLRCEYLSEALGVGTAVPRFGWQLIDPQRVRGRAQSAYQIQVERVVDGGRTMLWDSGKIASDQSVNIEYAGQTLRSGWDCRWRVRVWDESGEPTDWSGEGRLVMGLLEAREWVGDWIRCEQAEDHHHIWYRKTFDLDAAPVQAIAYICSIGYHELYINGRRIGDAVLAPGVTNLARRALYMTYDIAEALRPGKNVMAVWTGPGWARADGSYGKGVWEQTPMFRAQLHFNGEAAIHTDRTWRCTASCSENIGLWKGGGRGTYGGERIDARRHLPDWNAVEFDDSDWPVASTGSQVIELSSALFEPDRKIKTLRPVSIEQRDGAWRIDMGENYTGWFEIDLRGGRAGDVAKIHTSNRLEVTVEYDQESEYIFDASGEGTFCHRFNWMAGRWITIHGPIAEPAVNDIRGYIVTNDRNRLSSFECSNGMLNGIYHADLRTYLANTVNAAVMDCPHRERYGYGEVALACTWGCAIPNFESAAMYTKVAQDWCDVQSEDGMINTIAPQPYAGAGGTLWSSAPVTMCWEFYRAYGDKRLVERVYPTIKRWLNYLHSAVTEDGVLMPYTVVSRFLGDWATPHGNEYGNLPEAQLFNNCVYAYNLMIAIEAAKLLGHDEHAALYQQRLDDLRRCAHEYFYDADTGKYGDGRQMAMLFPLYVRLTPDDLRDSVLEGFLEELNAKGYLDTGSPGLPIMFKCVLEDWSKPEVLYKALTRGDYPSYGYFLARGESTWPEYWEVDGIKSRIHTCYTGVAGYFIKGMAGIQPAAGSPGMRHVVVRPYFPKPLTHIRATTASLFGPITSNIRRLENMMHMQVIIPANSRATVYLPSVARGSATESSNPIEQAAGVKIIGERDGALVVEIAAGAYAFEWEDPWASDKPEAQ